MDSSTACLVNLNRDPQLNELLYYQLKKGTTVLGREDSGMYGKTPDKANGAGGVGCNGDGDGGDNGGTGEVDIFLTGDLIARRHWWVVCAFIG